MKTAKHPNNEAAIPEEDMKPPAKRPRRKKGALKSEEPTTDDDTTRILSSEDSAPIPVDAMVNVMEFLPPRSLYNIALTCKSLREMVTTKMVVQSALIHGGHAKKTMEELYALMSNHSIHIPSPPRLLRLANGKRCEFCFLSGTNHVRPGLGVFACWDCVASGRETLTRAWKTSWARYNRKPIYQTILSYPRVASNGYSTNHYFWSENRSDASGERVGPLVTWGDVDALCGYYDQLKAAAAAKEAAAAATADTGDSATASNAAADAKDKKDGDGREEEEEEEEEAPPSLNNGEWIDYYLTKNLNAPPKEDYVEFNHTFTYTLKKAKRISREREALKKSKRDDKKQIKVAKVEKMLDDLKALIDEPFRERAIRTYGKEKYLKCGTAADQCIHLETLFIDTLLKPYIKSPSKMKKKIMKELAENINAELDRIEKLLEMDFLSDNDDFEAAAKSYLRECFPNVEALYSCKESRNGKCNLMDGEFLGLMQSDRFFGALCHLKKNDLSPMLLVMEPSASLVQTSKYLDESSLKFLAQKAFAQRRTSFQDREDDSWLAEKIATGHEYFGAVMKKIDNFGTWLEAEGKADEDRRKAIFNGFSVFSWTFDDFMKIEDSDNNKIWEWTERSVLPYLRSRV